MKEVQIIMFKKTLTVLLCSAFLVAGATAATAAEKKVLRVGMECAAAPFNWSQSTTENGAVRIAGTNEYANGYDVLISKMLADALGMELEVYKIEWDGLPPALVTGKIDAVVASMAITEKRKQTVDFTVPYYYANTVALVRKDSEQAKAQSLADFSGARATTQLNSVWYELIDQIPGVVKLPALDNIPTAIVALQSGKCDVLVVDDPTAQAAEVANPDLMMLRFAEDKGFKTTAEHDVLGVAVKKGNTELREAMNVVLSKLTDEDRAAIMSKAIRMQPLMQ